MITNLRKILGLQTTEEQIGEYESIQEQISEQNRNLDEVVSEHYTTTNLFKSHIDGLDDNIQKGVVGSTLLMEKVRKRYEKYFDSYIDDISKIKKNIEKLNEKVDHLLSKNPDLEKAIHEQEIMKAYETVKLSYKEGKIERSIYEQAIISTEDLIEKARSGVYKNTPENKKLGRVGLKYGEKKQNKIKEYENRSDGEFHRISQTEDKRELSSSGRNEEASSYIRTNESTSKTSTGVQRERRLEQIKLLEDYAKKEGIWHESIETFLNKDSYIDSGAENQVFKFDEGFVAKINNLSIDKTPLDYLDRISYHNAIFPDVKYEVIGFGKDESGKFSILTKQPFIISNEESTKEEIDNYMGKLGFNPDGLYNYKNSDFIISDVHEANVLKSDGKLFFIDTFISKNDIDGEIKNRDEIKKAHSFKTKYADCIIRNNENKILFLKRDANNDFEPDKYGTPGGHVDAGEDFKTAAIRECQEETGLKVTEADHVFTFEDDNCIIQYFECEIEKNNPFQDYDIFLHGNEHSNYRWLSYQEYSKEPLIMNLQQILEELYGDEIYKNELRKSLSVLIEGYKSGKIEKSLLIKAVEKYQRQIDKPKKDYKLLLERLEARRTDKQHTKEQAEYVDNLKEGNHTEESSCDRCEYYRPKQKDNCIKVVGKISLNGRCKFFDHPEIEKSLDIIQKAFEQGLVSEDMLEKAKQHKYLRKEVDNKGKYNYIYKEKQSKEKSSIFDIDKIKQYAEEVIKGGKQIERLSPEEERGRIRGGQRNVEATIVLGTSKDSDDEFYERGKELNKLKQYAQKAGCWIDDYKTHFGEDNKLSEATESEVFYDDKGYVIKVNNFSQHEIIAELFDRIAIQNVLFPDTSYELLGFTERDGEVNAIMKQPFIVMKTDETGEIIRPSKQALSEDMSKMGFEDMGGNMFINSDYIVEDLHSKNVCYSQKGQIMYIDPVIRINIEDEGYGGDRKFGKIDMRNDIQKSLGILEKALQQNLITEDTFQKAVSKYGAAQHVEQVQVKGKDGQVYTRHQKVGGGKEGEKKEPKNYSEDELHDHAKQASEQDLQRTIKESGDSSLREVAHKELERRNQEEHIPEEKDKKEENKKTETHKKETEEEHPLSKIFKTMDDSQVEFYLNAPNEDIVALAKKELESRGKDKDDSSEEETLDKILSDEAGQQKYEKFMTDKYGDGNYVLDNDIKDAWKLAKENKIDIGSENFYSDINVVDDKDYNKLAKLRFSTKFKNIELSDNWGSKQGNILKNFEEIALKTLPKGHVANNDFLRNFENHDINSDPKYAYYNKGSKKISLSNKLTDPAQIKGDLNVESEFKAVMCHEIGHAVESKLKKVDENKFKEFAKVCGWSEENALKFSTGTGEDIERNSKKELLTKYAHKSSGEAFAEYYSIYSLNKDSIDKMIEGKMTWNIKFRGITLDADKMGDNIKILKWIKKNVWEDEELIKALMN